MALQPILSPNRRESLPTPSAGVRITGHVLDERPARGRQMTQDEKLRFILIMSAIMAALAVHRFIVP